MNKLERYIARFATLNIFIVLAVLVALFLFFMFIDQTDDIGEGEYTALLALQYVALQTPRWIYELFPVSVLLGTLVGLGILANNNELTVARAAGVSIFKVGMAVIKVVLLLLPLIMLMDNYVTPYAMQSANNLRSIAKHGIPALQSGRATFWLRDGPRFIHINQVQPDGSLSAVSAYEFDEERRLVAMTRAELAHFRDSHWQVQDIVQTLPKENGIDTATYPEVLWQSAINPQILNLLVLKPENLSVIELYQYIQYLRANKQHAALYELELWMKAVYPLTTIVMVLLALPFVFGALRSVAIGQRILAGAMLGVGFHIFNETVTNMGLLYHLSAFASAVLPTFLFLCAALLLLWRKLHHA
jgi:lipopolysaccharide export system permease protein